MSQQQVKLEGHFIDQQILSQVLDTVERLGGSYEILQLTIGRTRRDKSTGLFNIDAPDDATLQSVLRGLARLGAEPVIPLPVRCEASPADGVLPDRFYATTNLPTEVLVNDRWLPVAGAEMDLALVVDERTNMACTVPMADVKAGQQVVVGTQGVRVSYPPRDNHDAAFRFMASSVSAEKPKRPLLQRIVQAARRVKQAGGKILLVGGPAIIHTGAGPVLEQLIRDGWVDVLFAGNALAAHDIESALYGTSLGVPVGGHPPGHEGHAHHLWAINRIRMAGSIAAAVETGVLTGGVMHACISRSVPFVLAGSIRDDGPLPDVITDVLAAQRAMRSHVPGVGMAIMVGTTLHAIATGNLLPARVVTVCVDVNPAVVTKLQDRGSHQSLGIVMDAASFLEQLADGLGRKPEC
jgi:lysine-ketoglutarate reductase/saccharopine dehydrogenase-like protein (TIGR00300 family)